MYKYIYSETNPELIISMEEIDDHIRLKLSNENFDSYFINNILPQLKTKNLNTVDLIKKLFYYNTEYIDNEGLFFISHSPLNHDKGVGVIEREKNINNPLFGYAILSHNSSPKWWKNLESFLKSLKKQSFDNSLFFFKTSLEVHNSIYLSSTSESRFLFGSTELITSSFWAVKNIALSIAGWDNDDPPMEFIIIGNKDLIPKPRSFCSDVVPCLLSVSANKIDGQIIDIIFSNYGSNYRVGDEIKICSIESSNDAIFRVNSVENNGAIKDVSLIVNGTNYTTGFPCEVYMHSYILVDSAEFLFPQHKDLFY